MSIRKGTIVRFPDGRVAVKKLSDRWEVSGTTIERYRDEDLDVGYAVVYTPVRNVSEYKLGTAVLVGKDVFVKVGQTVIGSVRSSEWTSVNGEVMTDAELAATDYIELYLGETL